MEQQIRFCTTSDGVTIAYAVLGEGPPLVYVNGWPGHIGLEWEKPVSRQFLEKLAIGVTLVRYDMRGSGLSDRDVSELSFEGCVSDLEAVVEHLGLDRFALLGLGFLAGPIAITYAASHEEQVTNLILSSAYFDGSELATPEVGQKAVEEVSKHGFPFAIEKMETHELEARRDTARILREGAPLAVQGAVARAMLSVDTSHLVERLSMPALVMHGRNDPIVPFALGRALAARLPNASFVPFEELTAAPWTQQELLTAEIRRFLGVKEKPLEEPAALAPGTAIILFLDIADSTALTTKLGDAAYREKERELDIALRAAITEAGGTPVEGKVLGDGVMAVFTSARQAINAAVRCRDLGNEAGLPLHLGIHAGDVVREGNYVHGGAVQLAARVQSVAAPGEILVSATVRDLGRTSAGVAFEDRGEHELKGIVEPQRLFAVRRRD